MKAEDLNQKCDNLVKNVRDGIINSAEAVELLKKWHSILYRRYKDE